ncbi:diacylglycerol kinase family lipid kinase [Fictibacillus sp. 7GRE50]|uniref:diacylglycerol/lipid kinase family protein n=1 Tax=Fictibacillus sp. 7GRE50 TaxID=2745878 RepID=UPI0018CD3B33|nr:diacylglycerol kinase family protein [Fictibacillus sp. 7GRE50]MBH0163495.1 diacylglycerol kinase family lipid kinase [Fictibacillus sp. 7GRE50]
MKKYFFIINANNAKAIQSFDQLKNVMDKESISYRTFYTEYSGHATEIAKKITYINKDDIKAVIAVGGDGTVHEVLNGMKENPSIPLGFISGGSGNDIVRVLTKEVKGVKKQLLYLKRNRTVKTDSGSIQLLGRSNKIQSFISAVGIGLDGEVAKFTNEATYKKYLHKLKLGSLAYVFTLFKVLKFYVPDSMEIRIDGHEHQFSNVWLVAVGNMPYYGGGMKICPSAKCNDGVLDVCIVHDLSLFKLLLLFVSVFWGGHVNVQGVSQFKGKEIEVITRKSVAIHADGEYKGTTPVRIEVQPGTVSVKI